MSKVTKDRIRGLELFSGCRRAQVKAIDGLGSTIDIPKDTVLCREGSSGREFFVLADGTATVHASNGAVAVLHQGAWFGEIALMRGIPRQATVTTLTAVTLLVFDSREFAELLDAAPCIRPQLERSTELVRTAARPTVQPWYQPVRYGRDARIAFST